jgi:class 3 adenylate cyclase
MCNLALEMQEALTQVNQGLQVPLDARFGINSGPVVAGVIGLRKFAYDIWGDTVNVASRMESHGVKNRIQIASNTYELVKDHFACEERGFIEVKGKGTMHAFWLNGKKQA